MFNLVSMENAGGKCDTFAPLAFNETFHEQAPQGQAGCPRGGEAGPGPAHPPSALK